MLPQQPLHGSALGFDLGRRAVHFHEQHGGGIGWIPRRIDGRLHRGYACLVHHLQRRRNDACRDHRAHGLAGGPHTRERGEHRPDAGRQRLEPDGDLQRDPEHAFAADEQAHEVGAPGLSMRRPERRRRAVRQHDVECDDVVRSHAVLEAVGAAGVLGYVAADGARRLAGGIGDVLEPVRGDRLRQPGVHHARLHDCPAATRVHLQDPVQAGERDEHRVGVGQCAAGEPGTRPPRDERDTEHVKEPDELDDLPATSRNHHRAGERLMGREPVHGVRGELGPPVAHPPRTDDAAKRIEQ
jgi:hypothetical protein